MDTHTLFDGFDQFDHAQYAEEAKERWGETEAYRESTRRTRRYTKEDWATINAEAEAIYSRMAEVMSAGRAPEGPEATTLAEEHRLHIDRWFYPCSHAMHRALAEMYVGDPRFTRTFEQRAPGLAQFFAAAIRANAERVG